MSLYQESSTHSITLRNAFQTLQVDRQFFTPTGTIVCFAGSAAPAGWLFCRGQAVSRSTYADLFGVLGTAFGAGDGTTTFHLPDLRQRLPLGRGDAAALGQTGGSDAASLAAQHLPAHTHTGSVDAAGDHTHGLTDPGHTHSMTTVNDDLNSSGGAGPSFAADSDGSMTWYSVINSATTGLTVNAAGNHTHTFTTDSTGDGDSFSIMNPYLVLNYLIRC